jgi:fibronectin-binding autotransporter adhesin
MIELPPPRLAVPRSSRALPHAFRKVTLIAALASALTAFEAQAIDLFWDPNLAGAGIGGSGTWNLTAFNWAATEAGIQVIGSPIPSSNGRRWTNVAGDSAILAGSAGTVTVAGTLTAGQLDFRTDGYRMTGGTVVLDGGASPGRIRVAPGVTATLESTLTAPGTVARIAVGGGGTAVLGAPTRLEVDFTVEDATLRAGNADVLGSAAVRLGDTPAARLDLGGLASARVGTLLAPRQVALGNTRVLLTGNGPRGLPASAVATLQGSTGGGMVVGTEFAAGFTLGRSDVRAAASSFGFLHGLRGTAFIQNADVALNATGISGLGGDSSLLLDGSFQLTVAGGAQLEAAANPQLRNNSGLTVRDGARFAAVRPAGMPGAVATLRVGSFSGTATATVTGNGSRLESEDVIRLGNEAQGGDGSLVVGFGALAFAPVLTFASSASTLTVRSGGVVLFGNVTGEVSDGPAGTLFIDGGIVTIGDPFPPSPLRTADSTFLGLLRGSGGSLSKLGSGKLSLFNADGDYSGRVRAGGGTLEVLPGVLRNAILSLAGDGQVTSPFSSSSVPLSVGAIEDTSDLALANTTLLLGGGNHDARWRGRVLSGTVGLRRETGTGIQTIVGGTEDAPFVAPFLSASAGTFRLDGGHFRFTNTTSAVVNTTSLFSQPQGLIEITGGAKVEAGSGARIHDGGRIVVRGAGTRLSLFPGTGQVDSQFLVGPFGGGTLTVTDGASADATFFLLGSTGQATPRSEIVVSAGGLLEARNIIFDGAESRLTVNGGSVFSHFAFVRSPSTFRGGIFLSDRDADSPALTLGKGFDGIDFGNEFSFDGRIANAASGPGSIRKVRNGILAITTPLEITGRLIVDGGQVRSTQAGSLASVVARLNTDDALLYSQPLVNNGVVIGGLEGAGNLGLANGAVNLGHATDATWRGRLTSGTVGIVRRPGAGIQTFVGGAEDAPFVAPFLSVSVGTVRLAGGHFQFTNQILGPRADTSLFSEFTGLIDITDGADVRAGSGVRIHNGARILVRGEDTRLTVVPFGGDASIFLGSFGGGTLEISDGAQVAARLFRLGNASEPDGVSRLVVSRGASLLNEFLPRTSTNGILFSGLRSSLTVDRATAHVQSLIVDLRVEGGPAVFLSDDPLLGPALVLGEGAPAALQSAFSGRIADAESGPGSIRKLGAGIFEVQRPLEITGRVIVDGGRVRGAQARSLASVVARLNVDDGLQYLPDLVRAGVFIGGLEGDGDLSFANGTVNLGHATDATWRGRFTSGTVGLRRESGTGTQTFVGGTADAPFVAPFLSTSAGTFRLDGGRFRFTNTTDAGINTTSLFSQREGLIEITGGATVEAGTGARIHDAGRILVTGAGTTLSVFPATPTTQGGSSVFRVGALSGGTLEVADGASVDATFFLLGNRGEASPRSEIVVRDGGVLKARNIQFEGPNSVLTVDRGSVQSHFLIVPVPATFAGGVFLSDRDAASPALTLGKGFDGVDFGNEFSFDGRIADAASGPGSIRKLGAGTLALTRPLEITGRMIIDGGKLRLGSATDLATVTLVVGTDDALALDRFTTAQTFSFGGLAGSADLDLGALHSLTLGSNPRSATFDGHLALGGTLAKGGTGAQTFTGGAEAGHLIVNDGNLILEGGTYVLVGSTNGGIPPSLPTNTTGHLSMIGAVSLDVRTGATATASGGIFVDAGAHIAVDAGGALQAEAVVLDFGSLTNNGTLSGRLIVEEGGVAKGGGTFDAITLNAGGTFGPGNSPGVARTDSVTLNPGARFEVEVADATGEAGVGFDLWDIEGTVDFDAGATGDERFVIALVSLDAGNTPGLARNFDASQQFSWTVLRADEVRGFDPAEVTLDASRFANPRNGAFTVALDLTEERAELRIIYQPVPEPGTNAMIVCGLAALLVWRRRGRRG